MVFKTIKYGLLSAVVLGLAGTVVFGSEVWSYLHSGAHRVRSAVKESVPLEFELARARDTVGEIVPEIHANIRMVAQQEVEIAALREEIAAARQSLTAERGRLAQLRECLGRDSVSFAFAGVTYTRDQVKTELVRRLEMIQESEVVLSGKQRLLENRQSALAAAIQVLDRTRSEKTLLEQQISALESQHRLIQAASVGSGSSIDTSKLAESRKLIAQIKKQLDVAERVLAQESRFLDPMPLEVLDEGQIAKEVDDYLVQHQARPEPEQAAAR